jgi:hypothetical protein
MEVRTGKPFMIALLMCGSAASAAEPVIDIDAEARYESNVGNTLSKDALIDRVVSVGATAAKGIVLDERSGLVLKTALRYDEYARYRDLSRVSLSGGAKYRMQPTAGYSEPWFEFAGSAELLRHRNSPIRDGAVWSLQAAMGKNITDRIRASTGVARDVRQASEGLAFDTLQNRLFAAIDYQIADTTVLYANVARVFGDQVASGPDVGAPSWTDGLAKAENADGALSKDVRHTAWRIDAITNLMTVGMNVGMRDGDALEIGALHFRSQAGGGFSYSGYILHAGYLRRF